RTRHAQSPGGGGASGNWDRYLENKTQAVFDVFKSGQLFPFVITVCSETEAKGCPIFAGVTKRLHWPFPDPSQLTGTSEEKLEGTREILQQIDRKIRQFCGERCAAEFA